MALNLDQKKAIVSEVSDVARIAVSAVTAINQGLTVKQMTQLRNKARSSGVYLRVVKNTLAKRALSGTEFSCLHDALVGPTILAFSKQEPSAAARLLRDFIKDNEKMIVKSLALGGKAYDGSQLEAIAKLPTKDEAISQLMATMKEPIAKFVRTVQAPHAKLVRTIAAVSDAKKATS